MSNDYTKLIEEFLKGLEVTKDLGYTKDYLESISNSIELAKEKYIEKPLADELVAEIIKDEYNKGHESRNVLDTKAHNMMVLSSSITTALIGIVTFLITNLLIGNQFLTFLGIFLGSSLFVSGMSIYFFLQAYSLKKYCYAYQADSLNNLLDETKTDKSIFQEKLLKNYYECLQQNKIKNDIKISKIIAGQHLLLASMLFVIFIVLIIFISVISNIIILRPS